MEAPTKFPTKIPGSFFIRAFVPTDNSEVEERMPISKKEIINWEIPLIFEIFSVALIANPEPIQTPIKENK